MGRDTPMIEPGDGVTRGSRDWSRPLTQSVGLLPLSQECTLSKLGKTMWSVSQPRPSEPGP